MSNAAKVHEFLNKAQVFYFLTTDGDQPKGRPFGFQMLVNDTLYFGCGPKVEVLALCGNEFMRYDGTAKVTSDAAVLGKVRETFPQIMALYDQKGWEMGVFSLENGHVEIRDMGSLKEEFDL